jgi:GTP-binding protein
MTRKIPSVVLVGRPNVGKSTLFNRIIGSRRAIVTPIPGTTRDALAEPATWRGVDFDLLDTGGLYGASQDPLHALVVQQGRRAIVGADLLLFLVDGREGLVAGDEIIAREIRTAGVPVVLAVNKADDKRSKDAGLEFYQLGFEPIIDVSAEHGTGIGDLLDEVVSRLPLAMRPEAGAASAVPRNDTAHDTTVAIVGRPNVGKSSILNRLLREERALVSDLPGTTRDSIDALLTWHRRRFRIGRRDRRARQRRRREAGDRRGGRGRARD